ncbi:MAG: carbamoyl phosphate synthase small subunit, partial [Candidatus Tectomicrobia bacterium]|nr:carbamoyl phosphate synthase small subunit [Candidatus Tectomicrobia bacterium]
MAEALLALADGTVYKGTSCGAEGETAGEVVFNTSLTGYPEVLTDPSYKGQIVTMTYPLIGNYGLHEEDFESRGPMVEGFIVKEASPYPSSWRSKTGLSEFLRKHGIVGIQGIDTRALTRRIRERGVIEGVISTIDLDPKSLLAKARACPGLIGRDLVKEVTCRTSYEWNQGTWNLESGYRHPVPEPRFSVIAMDFGIKLNILRKLVEHGCQVTVIPATTSAAE